MNPQECVWENSIADIIMKTHIEGKGEKSLQHYSLVHKFIPMPQAMKNSCSESSGGQGMGKKLEEHFGVEPEPKVRSKQEVIDEARTKGAKSSFCITDGHYVIWKNAELEAKHQKIQRSSCIPVVILLKDYSGSYAVFHGTRIVCFANDGCKSDGRYWRDYLIVQDKPPTQCLLTPK